jgi:hypothetical protein
MSVHKILYYPVILSTLYSHGYPDLILMDILGEYFDIAGHITENRKHVVSSADDTAQIRMA